MKKTVIVFAIAAVAFLSACEKKEPPKNNAQDAVFNLPKKRVASDSAQQ